MANHKEVEILMEVKDSQEKVLQALSGFESLGIKKTLDIYFYDPLRKELQPTSDGKLGASFRIREKNDKCSLAYKVDHFIGELWSHSDEYEIEIMSFDTGIEIITKLGLTELIRIDNEKHTYKNDQYEIVFEDVKDLGLFIEIEKLDQVDDDQVLKTKEEMRQFLTSLGISLGEEQNAGKPELMLRKNKSI